MPLAWLHSRTALPFVLSAALAAPLLIPATATAQCPAEPTLQHYTGGGTTACPCFVTGEQAGAVFDAPVDHYPIEILRVGIGWGSAVGGAPQSLEESIHIYPAGLPAPGTPLFSLDGPQLDDGFINEFDLEPIPGEVVVNSGPFTVALEFANPNVNDVFAPTVVHDGNGCQSGKNVIFAIPGGWLNACAAGVSGDWVFHVVYRRVSCGVGVEEELFSEITRPILFAPRPNPSHGPTDFDFVVPGGEDVAVLVFDVNGRRVRELASGRLPAGRHRVTWDGRDAGGARVAAGIYVVELSAGGARSTRKVTLTE